MAKAKASKVHAAAALLSGSVGASVAASSAAANPTSWADKYTYDFETGSVVAKGGGDVPAAFHYAAATKHQDGSVSLTMPTLATAKRPMMSMNPGELSWDSFGLWDNLGETTDGKGDMRRSVRWWRDDPLVFNCINFLSKMSNARLTYNSDEDGDQAERKLVENWLKDVMPFEFRQQWFLEYFRTGMVPVMKTLVKYKPKVLKDGKIPGTNKGNIEGKAVASLQHDETTDSLLKLHEENETKYRQAVAAFETAKGSGNLASPDRLEKLTQAVAATQYEWLKGMIPGAYTVLDPVLVDMEGPIETGLLRQPFLRVSGELRDAVMTPTPQNKPVLATIPFEITQQIKAGAEKVWLSPNICSMTFGDKQAYERYPTPICVHAFNALKMKQELMRMDEATANTVKNRILLVKVGNDEYPEFDGQKISEIQNMFSTPGRNMTFVWNHCIELEWVEPNLDSLKDTEKYKFWNSEVRTVFGISPVLTGTSETAGSIGNSMMNFKGVEEMVGEAQGKYLEFLHREIKMFKAALGLKSDIFATFDSLNTKDELQYWSALSDAVMNGIIDHQTMLETLNFKFPVIQKRMEMMKKLKAKGLFVPQPSANNLGPDGAMLPQKSGVNKGGKPANKPGAKNNKNRVGQSTPKKVKATAKLMPVNENMIALVVEDAEGMTPGHFQDVADRFNCPLDWVMTKSNYVAKYGEIDMDPAWPAVKPTEMLGILKTATKIEGAIEKAVEDFVTQVKGTASTGGKRAPYVTESKKAVAASDAMAKALASYRAEHVGDNIPKAWGKYVAEAVSDLTEQYGSEMGEREIYVAAYVMSTARLKKLRAASAAK